MFWAFIFSVTFSLFGHADDAARLSELKAHPSDTSEYHFNVGNLELRLGNPGLARAHLEKAKQMQPFSPKIDSSLRVARDSLGKVIGAERLDPATEWYNALDDRLPMRFVSGIFGILAFLLSGIRRERGALFCFVFGLASLVTSQIAYSHRGVVMIEQQIIRSGPGDQFLELRRVEPGIKLRLQAEPESSSSEWIQLRFSPDSTGWVKSSSVLLL